MGGPMSGPLGMKGESEDFNLEQLLANRPAGGISPEGFGELLKAVPSLDGHSMFDPAKSFEAGRRREKRKFMQDFALAMAPCLIELPSSQEKQQAVQAIVFLGDGTFEAIEKRLNDAQEELES